MTFSRVLSILAVAVALTGFAGSMAAGLAAAQTGGCPVNPTDLPIDAEEQAALDAINALRSSAGLATLGPSPTLGQAAAHKAATMAVTGIFGHDDPGRSWLDRVRQCGYPSTYLAFENLAMGTETGRATVQLWRDSPGHHQILINPTLRAIGIARVRASGGVWYWAANFGTGVDGGQPSPTAPTSAPSAATAPTSTPAAGGGLQLGALATVSVGRGDCLNVRLAPTRAATSVGCVPDGSVVRPVAGPIALDGAQWWQLDGLGWASGEYLTPGAPSGRAPTLSLDAVLRLPPIDEDPCLPAPGAAACDAVRLALWLGDYDAWVAWLGRAGLTASDVSLAALRFRAEQGSPRSASLLQAFGR